MGVDLILKKGDIEVDVGRVSHYFNNDEASGDITEVIYDRYELLKDIKNKIKELSAYHSEKIEQQKEVLSEINELLDEVDSISEQIGALSLIHVFIDDGWTMGAE